MGRNSINLDKKQIGEGLYHLLLHNNYIGSCSEKIVKKEKPEVNMIHEHALLTWLIFQFYFFVII